MLSEAFGIRWSAGACWLRARSCWDAVTRLTRSRPRRLKLAETLPLGDRRFVAIVEFDGARFLLGGTASSLVLLARMADQENERPGVQGAAGNTEEAARA